MPIYEYRCEKCGTVSEVLLLGREEQPSCKDCGSTSLTKLMSAPNISMGGGCSSFEAPQGSCCDSPDMCGMPHSCGNPGSCCGG
jgi:putative FmdB family regulatory protein